MWKKTVQFVDAWNQIIYIFGDPPATEVASLDIKGPQDLSETTTPGPPVETKDQQSEGWNN